MSSRSHRERAKGRVSGFRDYERYALIPFDVLMSEAFQALPDYAVRVLACLAGRCRKSNNGDLCLTVSEAKESGIAPWKLYAGLELLRRVGLILKTRQGGMRPYGPSLYALTWWPIVESKKYDPDISWGLEARNTWIKWKKPDDWRSIVRDAQVKQRGRQATQRAREGLIARVGGISGGVTIPR